MSTNSRYTNLRPLGISYSINKYASVERAYCELFLPNFQNKSSLRTSALVPIINMRPREILGLCLMCHMANHLTDNGWTIGTDPFGRDGAVVRLNNSENKRGEKRGLILEQVYIPSEDENFIMAFQQAVNSKESKGTNYTENINLVILSEIGEKSDLSNIIAIAQQSSFESCYLFIMKHPIPCFFEVAILKSPADPLEYYSLGINPADGSVKVLPKGYFKPVLNNT